VLVVDDSSINRYMLSQHVTQLGHRVAAVENGRLALERLQVEAFDLVLLDVMMPEMDGYTVLEQMKADPHLREIPVIIISGLDEIESVVRCIERGAEDYLAKPFNPTLLKARIGACLEKKRLWDELRQNYERLQALERLRDDLTHMIVHDLRTPLTSIITGLQTLKLWGSPPDDPEQLLPLAIRGGHTLLGMINDLLDISRMEGGSLPLERQELRAADLVDYALQQVTALAQERSLQMVRDLPSETVLFRGDEEKLRRVLVNLLGNAIKFSPTGGAITTSARWQESANAMLFSVRDTGEGIPAEATQRIFEKFGQVETRKAGRNMSTGLGLAFCKLAVEAHGGQIWVESELGQGSTFSFSLPLPSATP